MRWKHGARHGTGGNARWLKPGRLRPVGQPVQQLLALRRYPADDQRLDSPTKDAQPGARAPTTQFPEATGGESSPVVSVGRAFEVFSGRRPSL
jgi:hypothetical protein